MSQSRRPKVPDGEPRGGDAGNLVWLWVLPVGAGNGGFASGNMNCGFAPCLLRRGTADISDSDFAVARAGHLGG